MASAELPADGYAAVFLMDGHEVARQMRATEFDAFLDGYVGLSDLADTDVRAVYVQMGGDLLVRALVFFRIYFDDEGRADSRWNIPIERLAGEGSTGPDMGAGPIRLVCRSRCPAPRYASELWDPEMSPGANDFQAIRKAVEANHLKYPRKAPAPEEYIPVVRTVLGKPDAEVAEREAAAQRNRLAGMIREQRFRIKTLQSAHKDAVAELQRSHRLELLALQETLDDKDRQLEHLRLDNDKVRKRLKRRDDQVASLKNQLDQARQQVTGAAEVAEAERVVLHEQLERKQRELEARSADAEKLRRELDDVLRKRPDEDALMSRLKDGGLFVVAYHPGAGHITLPLDELNRYFSNPTAYAAERCHLTEAAYRDWLDHYDRPVCREPSAATGQAEDSCCGQPLLRVSRPADFRPGVDDRCTAHARQGSD